MSNVYKSCGKSTAEKGSKRSKLPNCGFVPLHLSRFVFNPRRFDIFPNKILDNVSASLTVFTLFYTYLVNSTKEVILIF